MTTATLQKKRWYGRTLLLTCDGRDHTVQYSPWGWNRESVTVDGVVAVRRRGGLRMSHGYRFWVDGKLVALSIAVPWWAEFLPVRDLTLVRLEVDGTVVYEEGRAPRRPLQWTMATEGFQVVQPSLGTTPAIDPRFACPAKP
jgi:hypothetical protein